MTSKEARETERTARVIEAYHHTHAIAPIETAYGRHRLVYALCGARLIQRKESVLDPTCEECKRLLRAMRAMDPDGDAA